MPDVKETPISFSDAMVRALREGRKTQTRRVILPQLPVGADTLRDIPGSNRWYAAQVRQVNEHTTEYTPLGSDQQHPWRCPYGAPGDRLWVKEAWHQHYAGEVLGGRPCYRADDKCQAALPWKSSRYMPRWASRILLELTDVRIQQVQEISEADAIAEGVLPEDWEDRVPAGPICTSHVGRIAFRNVWDSLNHKRGYGWDADPWVWLLTFKVLDA